MANVASRTLQPEAFELIAARFQVLSEPLRLRILYELHGVERNVSDLVATLGAGQPSISKHLKVLLEAGMVSRRQEGTAAYYQVCDPEIFRLCDLVCSGLEARIRAKAESALRLLGVHQ